MHDRADVRLAQARELRDRAIRRSRSVFQRDQLAVALGQPREQRAEPLRVGRARAVFLRRTGRARVLGRLGRRVLAPRAHVIDRNVARDREQPSREAREVVPVALARAPGLLERRRRQVLRERIVPEPIAEEVVDARQLLGVDGVPVGRGGRGLRGETGRQFCFERHRKQYTSGRRNYHRRRGRVWPIRGGGVTSGRTAAASLSCRVVMKRSGVAIGAVVAVGLGAAIYWPLHAHLEARRGAGEWQALKRYCTDCHNVAEAAGGVVFEGVAADAIAAKPEVFESAIRKLRGGLMPPPGNPRPDQKHIEEFVRFAEAAIDRDAHEPRAGYTSVQRLNRTEYAASVKDLLGVEIDAKQYLPTEIEVDGFDNIAVALSVSPAFLEQYIGVARKVARLAIGEPQPKLASVYFPPPGGDQDGYTDGLPPGTRGGTRFTHPFPADGEYRLTITDLDVGLYPRSLETEQTVVVLLDRDEVYRAKLGGREDLAFVDHGGAPARAEIMKRFAAIPLQVTAGVHEIVVTFVERSRVATEEAIFGFTPYGGFSYQGQMRVPRLIGGVEFKGPYSPTGVSRTPSRDKIFVCTPAAASEERACAEKIAATLARRAFRRPVGADDISRLLPFYEAGRKSGSFDAGIEQLVTAVLASPDFLYRAIAQPARAAAPFALDDFALASRLSFFLWNQGPDDELLALAEHGALHEPRALDAQVDRMLADPRAETLVTSFALKWLNV